MDEDHYPVPTSTYALSKVASETIAGHIAERGSGNAASRHEHDVRPGAGPLEQQDANRVFQLPDLRGQDLLGHVDVLGGGGEARLFGDRDEITKVPHLNVHRGLNPNRRANPRRGDKLSPGRLTN